jgi:hypothetical protein
MDFEEDKSKDPQANISKNRVTLFTMAFIFIAPVLFAYLAYFGGWFSGGGKSNGDIIADPWHIDDLAITEYSFGNFEDSKYLGKWNWLLVLDKAECDEQCEINWFLLQQTRLGLAKNTEKTEFLLMLNQQSDRLSGDWANIDFAKASIEQQTIAVDKEELKGFNRSPLPVNYIYLVDPLGNIFMRYPLITDKEQAPLKSKELRTDIARVLKYLDVNKKS